MIDNPNNNPLEQQVNVQAGGEATPMIMQKITIRPPYRHKIDILDWRLAMRSAEAMIPRYVYLFDLYNEMWLDGHYNSVASKRIMGVTNASWQYIGPDDKPIDAMNELIDTPDFGRVLESYVKARLEAYRMVECSYKDGKFNSYVIPPKHMRPRTGYVAFEQTGDAGINIRDGIYAKTVLEIGDMYDLGIALSAAQYVIYKRGGFADWANFVEVFGQPLIDAEWDGFDENQRVQLEEALDKMGNSGKITRPAGTKINFIENKANPNGGIQTHFVDQLNAEISKVILGQTETTESSDSSGYAQGKVHADVEDDINQSDLNYTRRGLNTRFHAILEAIGAPVVKGGKFIIAGEGEESISQKDKLEMDISMVVDLKLPVSDDYFYETYKIPKPANYAELKKKQEDAAAAQQMIDLGGGDPLKPDPAGGAAPGAKPANKPGAANKKAGKIKKLFLKYNHFFG